MIPGRDRREAVIMADHYDTAYMDDRYDTDRGGNGARLAAAGADDNHSATAALMLAAPIFLELSRQGKLGCDVWLVHLTGEEFPADCLGARRPDRSGSSSARSKLRLPRRQAGTTCRGRRSAGVYVSDMIAHNNDRDRDIFQISPGHEPRVDVAGVSGPPGQRDLERVASRAGTSAGRARPCRAAAAARTAPRSREIGPAPGAARRGARCPYDPRSTLYNTDGQIFSDAGVPVRAVHGELRHQPHRLPRHPRHDGEHRPGLRRGAGGHHDRSGGAGGRRESGEGGNSPEPHPCNSTRVTTQSG